jgi:hypothetical protein
VLKDIQKPGVNVDLIMTKIEKPCDFLHPQLKTPTIAENLLSLCKRIEESIAHSKEINGPYKRNIQKLANAAENAFTNQAILLDENLLLFEQNNEKATHKSIRATVVGSARVMSYEDIVEAQKQRNIKETAAEAAWGRRSKRGPLTQVLRKRSCDQELEEAEHEIRGSGMAEYCSVLDFK